MSCDTLGSLLLFYVCLHSFQDYENLDVDLFGDFPNVGMSGIIIFFFFITLRGIQRCHPIVLNLGFPRTVTRTEKVKDRRDSWFSLTFVGRVLLKCK